MFFEGKNVHKDNRNGLNNVKSMNEVMGRNMSKLEVNKTSYLESLWGMNNIVCMWLDIMYLIKSVKKLWSWKFFSLRHNQQFLTTNNHLCHFKVLYSVRLYTRNSNKITSYSYNVLGFGSTNRKDTLLHIKPFLRPIDQ